MKKPLIGVTLDSRGPGEYSKRYPWYALRKNYVEQIISLGALAIILPHEMAAVKAYGDLIDGLLLTGGDADVDPTLYGENLSCPNVSLNPSRTEFDKAILEYVERFKKPCLGICGGMQIMNVARGGSLYQDIPTQLPQAGPHVQFHEFHRPGHEISISPETLLFSISKKEREGVNSSHHQSVKALGRGLVISAVADDGVIEAIEDPQHPFFLGVQWHPEIVVSPMDEAIIETFVKACES